MEERMHQGWCREMHSWSHLTGRECAAILPLSAMASWVPKPDLWWELNYASLPIKRISVTQIPRASTHAQINIFIAINQEFNKSDLKNNISQESFHLKKWEIQWVMTLKKSLSISLWGTILNNTSLSNLIFMEHTWLTCSMKAIKFISNFFYP